MVQVLPPNQRKSFGDQILSGISAALPGIERFLTKKQEMQQMAKSREALRNLGFDDDLANLSPELQKAFVTEKLRSSSKEQLMNKKMESLGNIFGGGRGGAGQQREFSDEIMGQPRDNQMQSQGFDPSQLSDDAILQLSAIDPQLGTAARGLKDVSLREKRAQKEFGLKSEKFEEEKRKSSPEFKREQALTGAQAQADVKYNQELQNQERQGKLKTQTLDNLERLNKKGVTGKPYEKALEKFGLVALTSEGRREFAADVKNLITDIRSILGGQFSQFEFQTILNAYPSADFSKEANTSIINNLKTFQDIKNKEVEFARQIKKENNGQIPSDFQNMVNERVSDYAQSRIFDIKKNLDSVMREEYGIKKGNVLMFDPSGEPLNVPENEIGRYMELGATLP